MGLRAVEAPFLLTGRVTHRSPVRHHMDLEHRVGCRYVLYRQPELAPHNVASLRDRARLVERDLSVTALPTEAAIAGYDQALRRDILQSLADLAGHVFGPIGLK